jgi:hypothetical protein
MATLEELQKETDKYKNTLVLDFFEVKVFKEIIDDTEDYYYVYMGWRGNKSLCSCVGWFIPLIDRLDKDQYNYLARIWNGNNELQIEEVK